MTKVAINGFGRIGRAVFKRILDHHSSLEVVAVNDLTSPETLAHLLKYDSVHGIYGREVEVGDDSFRVGEKKIKIISEPEPGNLPWQGLGIDIVLECTGRFTGMEDAKKHLLAGAKQVIISANSKTGEVPHFVLGVNEKNYQPRENKVVAMCSCTTNCAALVIKVLHDHFNVLKAYMLTVHAVTSNQNIIDAPHKDLRRARAAFVNAVPTTTGAARAVSRVMPVLEGRISASAIRIPVICGSILEIVAMTEKEVPAEKINQAFKKAAGSELKGLLSVSDGCLVSSDIIGTPFGAIVDLSLTETLDFPRIKDGNLVKVIAWYDNEYGYACRLADFAEYIGKKL